MRLSGNVNIEKLGSLTPPNSHLVFEMEFQMTVPWKFYMRLPCFQFVQIQTRLSTWKMSFKTNMKSSWLWNSKYIQILGVKIFFESPLKFSRDFYLSTEQFEYNWKFVVHQIDIHLDLKNAVNDIGLFKDGWKVLMEIWTPSALLLHLPAKNQTLFWFLMKHLWVLSSKSFEVFI